MKENIEIFDFALNEEDISLLETFNKNQRTVSPFYKQANNSIHKYFPYKIEF